MCGRSATGLTIPIPKERGISLKKNFEKAMQVCDGILARYPQNPQFLALRLKVENSYYNYRRT